jgi:hypothetical protein
MLLPTTFKPITLNNKEVSQQMKKYKEKYGIDMEFFLYDDYVEEFKEKIEFEKYKQKFDEIKLNVEQAIKDTIEENPSLIDKLRYIIFQEKIKYSSYRNSFKVLNSELCLKHKFNYNKEEFEQCKQKFDEIKLNVGQTFKDTIEENPSLIDKLGWVIFQEKIKDFKYNECFEIHDGECSLYAKHVYTAATLDKLTEFQKNIKEGEVKGVIFAELLTEDGLSHGDSFIITKDKIISLSYGQIGIHPVWTKGTKYNIPDIKTLHFNGVEVGKAMQKDIYSCHVLEMKLMKQLLRDNAKVLKEMEGKNDYNVASYPDLVKYCQSISALKNLDIYNMELAHNKEGLTLEQFVKENTVINSVFTDNTLTIEKKPQNNTLQDRKEKIINNSNNGIGA